MTEDVVIAGYAETPIRLRSGLSAYELAAEAFAELLERTGLPKSEVDGFCATAALSEADNPFHALHLAEVLGLELDWFGIASAGGASILSGVAAAMAAIRDGRCSVAIVLGADSPTTTTLPRFGPYRAEFQVPLGVTRPPISFGLLMSAYQAEHGATDEALAAIAVTQRRHALLNELGCPQLRKPLSREEYLASRVIADPLRVLDSVMFCDGANAVLMMSEEAARSHGVGRQVRIAGYAECTNLRIAEPLASLTETGFLRAGPAALGQAGIRPAEVRTVQLYDDFTIAVLMQLEQLGFCRLGEGAGYVLSTDLSWTGALPLNTGGGQISAGQPGLASGGLNLVEAVRQLFGEAGPRQIRDRANALVTGIGGIPYRGGWMMSNVLVLEA